MAALKKYEWIGPSDWQRFAVGSRVVNLATIQDTEVAALLNEDPDYWGQKFRKKAKPAPPTETKKATKRDKTGTSVDGEE